MWTDHPQFLNMSKEHWNTSQQSNPLIRLWKLQKKVAHYLKQWNWYCFGNVYEEVENAEKNLATLEAEIGTGSFSEAALLANARKIWQPWKLKLGLEMLVKLHCWQMLKRFFWLQKDWNFFLNRRLPSIDSWEGTRIQNTIMLNLLTAPHFTSTPVDPQFFQEELVYTQKLQLTSIPTESEIWEALNIIDNSKVARLDEYTAVFYKKTWPIIKEDVVNASQSFFNGNPLPNYFASSSYVLISKAAVSYNWNQYRPISLTSVFNKLISKIVVASYCLYYKISFNREHEDNLVINASKLHSLSKAIYAKLYSWQDVPWGKTIWNKYLTPSTSFLIWRTFHKLLPVDDILKLKGLRGLSK
ncbi:uncharacterized protein LOC110031837 [Phalaenopsis equestris]|uniref:uncharacterized protein LOC110031837 n=1 Tax=Phalaenopsis equestris TaxID=78828 RepID=UPI0009E296F7|nr:uncharacterized protein LOC110031837 [Phalaenopsis equestris]